MSEKNAVDAVDAEDLNTPHNLASQLRSISKYVSIALVQSFLTPDVINLKFRYHWLF